MGSFECTKSVKMEKQHKKLQNILAHGTGFDEHFQRFLPMAAQNCQSADWRWQQQEQNRVVSGRKSLLRMNLVYHTKQTDQMMANNVSQQLSKK